jgi:hypothetical protein
MHGICQGTMPISMYLVLEALQAAGCKSWSAMGEYFGFWVLPNAYKSCNYLFAKKRLEAHRKSGKVKAPASEILTIYQFYNISARPLGPKPLARWLARLSFPNAISLTCWSACPMEVFQDASWTKQPKYATSCLMKLGGLHTKSKKNHWMMHYGDSLEEHGMLLSCFCQERKHKEILTAAKDVNNLVQSSCMLFSLLYQTALH